MHHHSDRRNYSPSSAINYKYNGRKEKINLERIARLMDTDRVTLNSFAKIKLWEDGPNYQKVVKFVNNSQCHPNIKLTVVNIHRVWLDNGEEEENLFHIPNRQLLWHGTKRANIPHILKNGFILPEYAGQMFGSGIYFADRISKSSNYSDLDVTFLLLCEVGLGKVYSCKNPHNDWNSAPVGFDTVKANGTYVPDWTDDGRYIGAKIPFGKTAKCTKYESHAVNYNEFIVYDPSRIIIRFLVEVNVEEVLVPTPLKLVTPRSIVPMNTAMRKSNYARSTDKGNGNSRIKTISLRTAPAAAQTTVNFTKSNNPTRPTNIVATPIANSSASSNRCTCINCTYNAPLEYPEQIYTRQSYPYSSSLSNNAYASSYTYSAVQAKKSRSTCVIL